MGTSPLRDPAPIRVAIVGAGRLGSALNRAWRRAGISTRLYRRGSPRDRWLDGARVIMLTVPDSAIEEAAAAWGPQPGSHQVVAHCSGALGLEVLAAANGHWGSLHPLCSVPTRRTPLPQSYAAIDGDRIAAPLLTRLARMAGLRPFRIPQERRALYHAAAVLASNGLFALTAASRTLMLEAGASREEALEALLPLVASALEGLVDEGLPGALTGPIARGDRGVVEQHLTAIAGIGHPEIDALYRAMSRVLLPLAEALGRAPPRSLAEIDRGLARRTPAKRLPTRPRSD